MTIPIFLHGLHDQVKRNLRLKDLDMVISCGSRIEKFVDQFDAVQHLIISKAYETTGFQGKFRYQYMPSDMFEKVGRGGVRSPDDDGHF